MARFEARKTRADEASLADLIRRTARACGRSVYQLAIDARVDQSTLNKFLNGDRANLRLDIADRLCRVLEIRFVKRKSPTATGEDGP